MKEGSMKRLISAIAVAVLGISLAPHANAATTVQGGPLTGLSLSAVTNIHLVLTGYPTTKGLYIEQAVKPATGSRPSTSGKALWVSAVAGDITQGATSIKSDLVLPVDNGHSWGADCAHQECGIFIRLDHNSQGDLSEDQFIPLTFDASTAPVAAPVTAALPADTLVVTANGKAMTENVPGSIQYRTPLTFAVTTGSGATATLKSETPDLCPVNGNSVDALKGNGTCDIAVTTPGDATHAAKTAHFPLMVSPAVQTLATTSVVVKVGKSVSLTTMTGFGEAITYKATSKNCSIANGSVKGAKVGTCALTASAAGTANYSALSSKVVVTVKK